MSSLSDSSILAGGSGVSDSVYQIEQSIRFNDDDSAYLSRTQPTSTTTNKQFTISFWIKRTPGTNTVVYSGHLNSSNYNWLGFASDDTFFVQQYQSGSNKFVQTTTRKFRDPAAWYHIVYIYDSAEVVSSERTRLYVNGQRETLIQYTSNTLYPTQNLANYWIYTGVTNYIGVRAASTIYCDAYIAELAMFQDQEYGPENFGEYNSSNIWIPKDGIADLNFGDSGFYIKGENSSDLGNDSGTANSGAGYDFTASGLGTHDQIIDTPTNNFCTLSPINKHANVTLSDGNLHALNSGTSIAYPCGSTILIPSSGKWYAEIKVVNRIQPHEYPVTGVFNNSVRTLITSSNSPGSADVTGAQDIGFGADERRLENGTNTDPSHNPMDDGNIAALAIDMDNKKIWWGHNQTGSFVWQNSGDPSAGTNKSNTVDFNTTELIFGNSHYSNSEVHWNFGQDGTFGGSETAQGNSDANNIGNFYYPVPTNYLALCTSNIGAD